MKTLLTVIICFLTIIIKAQNYPFDISDNVSYKQSLIERYYIEQIENIDNKITPCIAMAGFSAIGSILVINPIPLIVTTGSLTYLGYLKIKKYYYIKKLKIVGSRPVLVPNVN